MSRSFRDAMMASPASSAQASSSGPSSKKAKTSSSLPKGFFDDERKDAKARQVPVTNKAEEEWQAFQREMTATEQESTAIIEEDAEKATINRLLDEEQEQRQLLSKVEQLKQRKAKALEEKKQRQLERQKKEEGERKNKKKGEGKGGSTSSDSSDDEDDAGWVDVPWRSKAI